MSLHLLCLVDICLQFKTVLSLNVSLCFIHTLFCLRCKTSQLVKYCVEGEL